MKFRKISIFNFMRYKGENTIEFSCDSKKNVTVVMGDNTFGKTTLAQAFRWGLYGEIIDTRYGKSKDTILLNKDILANMNDDDQESVYVQLEVQEGEVIFQFKREAIFTRNYPMFKTRKVSEKLWMRRKIKDNWDSWIDNNSSDKKTNGTVDDNIKIMFPKELSSYFFFDGERWSDERRTNAEIKASISTLMGITPLVKMKEHLYNGNGKSVIKTLESKITGNSSKFDDISKKIKDKEDLIERLQNEIKQAEYNAEIFHKKVQNAKSILESNKKIEENQKEYSNLEKNISNQQKKIDEYYEEMIRIFSANAYKFFAAPLLKDVVQLLKDVDLEGKDIPDITTATLDYLINNQTCLCGNPIGEKEIKCIEELRKVIPPNVIGSYVGQYQTKIEEWKIETEDFVDTIKNKADRIEGTKGQIMDDIERMKELEKIIDGKINFSLERKKMKANEANEDKERDTIRRNKLSIDEINNSIGSLKDALKTETAHTTENRRIQKMITYAKKLYAVVSQILKEKEEPLLNELNKIIKDKFVEMFHEKEKYAQMGSDYRLHLYYNKMGDLDGKSKVEELSLSEGEIIARNFVFIVSILELAKNKKKEDDYVLNLPLVLDGPFSKLGDVNTTLIAQVLPNVAEQVIIFMLDKDWDASGLDKYTLPEYRYLVKKNIDENSAIIERR